MALTEAQHWIGIVEQSRGGIGNREGDAVHASGRGRTLRAVVGRQAGCRRRCPSAGNPTARRQGPGAPPPGRRFAGSPPQRLVVLPQQQNWLLPVRLLPVRLLPVRLLPVPLLPVPLPPVPLLPVPPLPGPPLP